MTAFVLHHGAPVPIHSDALVALGLTNLASIQGGQPDQVLSATIQAQARAIAQERVPDHLPRHKRR
jgi:hypothetical protein